MTTFFIIRNFKLILKDNDLYQNGWITYQFIRKDFNTLVIFCFVKT